jgi:hypothetical protein
MRPYSEKTKAKRAGRHGSNGRATTYQAQGPEFKSQYHKK